MYSDPTEYVVELNKKRTFLICPVRGHSADELSEVVRILEARGFRVHFPHRDTNQNDKIGYRICKDNLHAIEKSKVVHIHFDPESKGSLFDLGMAFALRKKLIVLNNIEKTTDKSFQNVLLHWQKVGPPK